MIKSRSIIALAISFLAFSLYASVVVAEPEVPQDPIEPVNRGIFWFNDQLDIYALEPVARGYSKISTEYFRQRVDYFFDNLGYPKYFVSDLMRGRVTGALQQTGRFLVNSTIGLLGIFDVATDWGLEKRHDDVGLAFADYGIPSGPYIVLPLLGPSNLRDGIGRIFDTALDPFYWVTFTDLDQADKNVITLGAKTVDTINTRAGLLEAVKAIKDKSVDFYLSAQDGYYQYRRGLLYDGHPPDEEDDMNDELFKDK